MTKNMLSGKNFECFHAGDFNKLGQYVVDLPADRIESKVFLKERMGLLGIEVSLGCMPAGTTFPIYHRHTNNDELYIFVKGRGQFQVDDKIFDVSEGSSVKITPEAKRVWRNNGKEDLHYLYIQYDRRGPNIGNTFADAQIIEGKVVWPA
jgi:mannose-6-phosphate isomerase-like protein (cupin superfamily)